jgi:hypothetical protein
VRQQLAQFMIECEAARYTQLRSLTRQLRGLPPGPEGSMLKLFWLRTRRAYRALLD